MFWKQLSKLYIAEETYTNLIQYLYMHLQLNHSFKNEMINDYHTTSQSKHGNLFYVISYISVYYKIMIAL